LTNRRAMLFSARKRWANLGVDGGRTPTHTASDHTKKIKEDTEGVAAGTEIAPLYFSGVGWWVELVTEKSPTLRLRKMSPFAKR
jgi:hypothetical protein